MGSKGRQAHLLDVRLAQDDVEQLVDLHVSIARVDAVVRAQVDPREHDLGDAGALGLADLIEHRLDGHRTLGPARLPHDAVGAAVVAPVLDLDPQTGTAQQVRKVVALARGARAPRRQARRTRRGAGHVDLGGLGDHARRELRERAGVQVDHATGHHHEGLAGQPERVAHRLAGLRLGLARDGAGVDDDQVGLVLVHEREARGGKVGRDAIGFDAIHPASQVNHAGERARHAVPF